MKNGIFSFCRWCLACAFAFCFASVSFAGTATCVFEDQRNGYVRISTTATGNGDGSGKEGGIVWVFLQNADQIAATAGFPPPFTSYVQTDSRAFPGTWSESKSDLYPYPPVGGRYFAYIVVQRFGFFNLSEETKEFRRPDSTYSVHWQVSVDEPYIIGQDPNFKPYAWSMYQGEELVAYHETKVGEKFFFKKDGLISDQSVVLKIREKTNVAWDDTNRIWTPTELELGVLRDVDQKIPHYPCTHTYEPEADIQDVADKIPVPPAILPVINPVDPLNPGIAPPKPNIPFDANTNEATSGTIWKNPVNANVLDKQTYIEGVSKIEKQLQEVNSRLKQAAVNDTAITNAANAGRNSSDGNGNGKGQAAAIGSTADAFGSRAAPTYSASAPPIAAMSLTIPRVAVVNLDPASNSEVATGFTIIRNFIAWGAMMLYTWFAWGEFKSWTTTLALAPQAKGNPVLGGTGAQVTALVAASAITIIVVSFPALYWGVANYSPSFESNPFSDSSRIAQISYYLLFLAIPIPFLLALVSQAFFLRRFGLITTMVLATAIRYVIP